MISSFKNIIEIINSSRKIEEKIKGYTYLSSYISASGATKWLKIVLNDCFDQGTLVGIQIYKPYD